MGPGMHWDASIVAVLKIDKKCIRICDNFRMTVNPVSRLDEYPISKVEEVYETSKW